MTNAWPDQLVAGALDAFYGNPRGANGEVDPAWVKANIVQVPCWEMVEDGKKVTSIAIHRLCADSLKRVLWEIWNHYGQDPAKLIAAGLHEFGGSFNFRTNRNAPTKLSLHAYGAALDLAPTANPNDTKWQDNGTMLPMAVVRAFKAEGWGWGGMFSGVPDGMHMEASLDHHAAEPLPHDTRDGVAPATQPHSDLRMAMAKVIVGYEARRDKAGNIMVYDLPAGDGGGTFEVAGINDKYHKADADRLAALVRAGKFAEAESAAEDVIARYTDEAAAWDPAGGPGVEFYLRDCCFNRGPTGGRRILQRAVGVDDDGVIGPATRAALDQAPKGSMLLARLRAAREQYERQVAHRDESSKFWAGLVNRWNNALVAAEKFATQPPAPPAPPKEPTVTTVQTSPAKPALPFDQIESGIEMFGRFGPMVVPFAGAAAPALQSLLAQLPIIELDMKLESAMQNAADPASAAVAMAAVARAWADKMSPAAAPGPAIGGNA